MRKVIVRGRDLATRGPLDFTFVVYFSDLILLSGPAISIINDTRRPVAPESGLFVDIFVES